MVCTICSIISRNLWDKTHGLFVGDQSDSLRNSHRAFESLRFCHGKIELICTSVAIVTGAHYLEFRGRGCADIMHLRSSAPFIRLVAIIVLCGDVGVASVCFPQSFSNIKAGCTEVTICINVNKSTIAN